jgi:PII-like signaling protein
MAMTELTPGKLLRVHLSEDDRYEDRRLYEAIVDRCREFGIAGATVFRALEGYGGSSEILRAHLLAKDQPVVVTIVETPENAARILPELRKMLPNGVIAVSDVGMVRVQKTV